MSEVDGIELLHNFIDIREQFQYSIQYPTPAIVPSKYTDQHYIIVKRVDWENITQYFKEVSKVLDIIKVICKFRFYVLCSVRGDLCRKVEHKVINTITDGKCITIKYSNEVPQYKLSGDEVFHVNKYLAFNCRPDSTVYIEVEITRHTGPRMLYGRLGFLFEGINDAEIQLEIPYSKTNSMRYQDSILLDSDTCYIGITEEYLNGIAQDISNFIENESDFPCCKITLCNASNCERGSCPAFYSIIIDTIMNIYMKHIDLFDSEQGEKSLLEYVKSKKLIATK